MLAKLADNFKVNQDLRYPHKGIVVDNQDPLRLGRVKCLIEGLLPGVTDLPEGTDEAGEDQPGITDKRWQYLPWIMPLSAASLGGGSDSSWFGVPEVGNELIIAFPWDDIYFGFYIGYWQSDTTHQGIHNEDYPDSYGFEDRTGFRWRVNKARRLVELLHPSGFALLLDGDGNVDLQTVGKISIHDPQGETGITIDPATGEITHRSPAAHRIENDLEITGTRVTVDSGSWNESLSGAKEITVAGGYKRRVGGSEAVVVASNTNRAAGGDETKTVGGTASHTYARGKTVTVVMGDYTVETKLGALEFKNILGNLKIPITGIVELNGILLKLQGGGQPALLGQDTVTWLQQHTHPTGVGPSGPPLQAATALQLLSPKTWLS